MVDLRNLSRFLQFWSKKIGSRFLLRKPQNARKARGYAVFEQKEKHICLVYKCDFLRGASGVIGFIGECSKTAAYNVILFDDFYKEQY